MDDDQELRAELEKELASLPAGKNPMRDIFSQLKAKAKEKDFLFLGRRVTSEMTFQDVLSTIPIGELESAASVGKGLALSAWKRVTPTAPPQLPSRGGTQQLGLYKFASLLNRAESTVPKTRPVERDDSISQYVTEAIFNTPAFQENAERFVSDPNEPALLRYLVGGVRAVDKRLESISTRVGEVISATFLKSPLEIMLQATIEGEKEAKAAPRVPKKGSIKINGNRIEAWFY